MKKKVKKTGVLFLLVSASAVAENGEFYFDSFALESKAGGVVDLDNLLRGTQQPPGKYRVDLYLNSEFKETRDVRFSAGQDGKLLPEFTVQDYEELGVKIREPDALRMKPASAVVSRLDEYIPAARTSLDLGQQRLDISVPQIFSRKSARGEVNKRLWDQGIPAAMLSYNVTGMENRTYGDLQSDRYSSFYTNLRPGFNVGPWRLRNNSVYNRSRHHSGWQSISTYLQRDLQAIRGQLQLGESFSVSDLFDSVRFKGAQIYSDESMLPNSMQGYAPVISGVSLSGGMVSIRQNGYVIYQENVAPGPFALTDLSALAPSGELEVTVKESDGSEKRFTQSYSAVPMMQREGQAKYSMVAGEYNSWSAYSRTPVFVQGSALYGLNNYLTLTGGSQLSEHYQSVLLGYGVGLGRWGSVSMDVTHANTRLQDESRHQGQSWRLKYAKDILQSGTTFTLVGYRYATSGFYDFRDANEISPRLDQGDVRNYNRRSRVAVQLNQFLQTWGSIFVSAYRQDYWNMDGTDETYSLGYSGNLGPVTLGVTYNKISQSARKRALLDTPYPQYDNDYRKAEDLVSLTLSFPLGRNLQVPRVNSMMSTDNLGQTHVQNGVSGTLTESNAIGYNLYHSYGNRGEGNGVGGSLDYRATYARLNGGYNRTSYSSTASYGMSGGVMVHENGITLSPDQGDSFTLIRAPGAPGILVDNQLGARTDWRGYAVINNASVYRINTLSLDTASLPDNVELDLTSARVVPTRGAVVRADFYPRVGERLLLTLRHAAGVVPFGAVASLSSDSGQELGTGIVGDNSEVYLSGVPEQGEIIVSWGKQAGQQCRVELRATDAGNKVSGVAVERRVVQCR